MSGPCRTSRSPFFPNKFFFSGHQQMVGNPVNTSKDAVQAAVAGHVHLQGSPEGELPNTSPRVTAAELSAVTFLGTSSAQPQPGVRNMSSLAVSTAAGSCKCPCGGWDGCVGGARVVEEL